MIWGVVNLGRGNDARLLRLQTALALGTGFQLVLVEAEPGPIRKEVVRRIQTWSGRASIGQLAIVSLDPDVTLTAQLGVPSGAIVMGLESSGPLEPPARDWISELNWSRDALPGLVPGPLVLVVSQAVHHELFERAPDLYSWRRHTAHVTLTVRELALPLTSPGDRYWLEQRSRLVDIIDDVRRSSRRITYRLDLVYMLLQLGDERGAAHALDELSLLVSSLPVDAPREALRARCKHLRAECALLRRDFRLARVLVDELGQTAYDDDLEASLALLRGRLHAADGAWDAASRELARVTSFSQVTPVRHLLARACESRCQVALAQGDITLARREITDFLEVASAHLYDWAAGMLVRLVGVTVEVYPGEIDRLLEVAFAAAERSSSSETMVAIECLRVKRAWLLERAEPARNALARAKRVIRPEDTAELRASVSLCEAEVALAAGSTSEDDVAQPLAVACDLFRSTSPGQAAVAGMLLGNFWRRRGSFERAVIAYDGAAEDARTARDLALASEAELVALGAAVDGELERADAVERLRALADGSRELDHAQSEGVARTDLGRCLLRRGLREAAVVELERARACFAATTDADGERSVVQLLEAAS